MVPNPDYKGPWKPKKVGRWERKHEVESGSVLPPCQPDCCPLPQTDEQLPLMGREGN